MSEKKVYRLINDTVRRNAADFCMTAPDDWLASFGEAEKSRGQEEMYHALFGEIAKAHTFMGQKQDVETWKRLLVDAFARIKAAEGDPLTGYGTIIPNLDGTGFVQLGVQTRRFKKHQASEFIEYIHAWMAEQQVAA